MTFTGLTTHKRRDCGDDGAYLGEPCLFHHHSTEEGTARCWRSAETHACLECEQEMRSGKTHIGLDSLATRHHPTILRFWRHVSIEGWDDCWQWTDNRDEKRLLFTWKRPDLRNFWRFHPQLVSMWTFYGDVGRVGSVSLCGNRRCCNPLHNRPLNLADDPASVVYELSDLQIPLESFKQDLLNRTKPEYLQSLDPFGAAPYNFADDPRLPEVIGQDQAAYDEAFKQVAQDVLFKDFSKRKLANIAK